MSRDESNGDLQGFADFLSRHLVADSTLVRGDKAHQILASGYLDCPAPSLGYESHPGKETVFLGNVKVSLRGITAEQLVIFTGGERDPKKSGECLLRKHKDKIEGFSVLDEGDPDHEALNLQLDGEWIRVDFGEGRFDPVLGADRFRGKVCGLVGDPDTARCLRGE
jgi:hypothetical protein